MSGSANGEIVTLQLGNYANYVGAHWWNLQESTFVYDPAAASAAGAREIDHDVLFREGRTLHDEVTYTPRLIAYDLRCNVGSLSRRGALYGDADAAVAGAWPEELVKRYVTEAPPESDYLRDLRRDDALAASSGTAAAAAAAAVHRERAYNLDESVRSWSDYLRVHLHPKSVGTIGEYDSIESPELERPFNVYGYGEQLLSAGRRYAQELEDSLHFFTEECDRLQGFHLLCDTDDGFGGFAAQLAAQLAEDYPRRRAVCHCALPLPPPTLHSHHHAIGRSSSAAAAADDWSLHRLANSALAWAALSESGACVVPMSLCDDPWSPPSPPYGVARLPYVRYRPELPYHTSAIVAAALDTATLPYRLRAGGRPPFSALYDALTDGGRPVVAAAVSLPFPMRSFDTMAAALSRCAEGADGAAALGATSLLPGVDGRRRRGGAAAVAAAPIAQSVVLRGAAAVAAHAVSAAAAGGISGSGASATLADLVRRLPVATAGNFSCVVDQPCVLQAPYPRFFDSRVILPDGRVAAAAGDGSSRNSPIAFGSGGGDGCLPTRLPVLASLQCSTDAAPLLRDVGGRLASAGFARLHRFAGAGLERDDFVELLETLDRLAGAYCD